MTLSVYNREKNIIEIEKVYGDKLVQTIYGTPIGRIFSHLLATSPLSTLYGKWQDSYLSKEAILPFISNFNIDMNDYLLQDGIKNKEGYSSFNNFFIRKFKEGKREFNKNLSIMPAFCEARYFGHESTVPNLNVPVKGKFLTAKKLLDGPTWEKTFENGPILVARLCPVDYHRFHYPDDGKILDQYHLSGEYHSVNPLALKARPDIFITNERTVTILNTKNFGKLAYIEVGAMCVGKIVQTSKSIDFVRGEEKGYFLFGGSTVIVLGEKGKWSPSKDILDYSAKGIEVLIKLGEPVGQLKL